MTNNEILLRVLVITSLIGDFMLDLQVEIPCYRGQACDFAIPENKMRLGESRIAR
jgi:hypothetical protein